MLELMLGLEIHLHSRRRLERKSEERRARSEILESMKRLMMSSLTVVLVVDQRWELASHFLDVHCW